MNEAPVHEASSHVTSPFSWTLMACAPGVRPRMLAVMTTISWLDLLSVVSNLTEPATSLPWWGRDRRRTRGGLGERRGGGGERDRGERRGDARARVGARVVRGGIAEDARHPTRIAGAGERDARRASARPRGALARAESAAGG